MQHGLRTWANLTFDFYTWYSSPNSIYFSLQCQANPRISPYWMCRPTALQCPGILRKIKMEPSPATMCSTSTIIKLASKSLRTLAIRQKHSFTLSCRIYVSFSFYFRLNVLIILSKKFKNITLLSYTNWLPTPISIIKCYQI